MVYSCIIGAILMIMTKYTDLIDEVMHLTQIATYIEQFYIDRGANELNHAELEEEIKELEINNNAAISKFQAVVKKKLWNVLLELNKYA